MSHSTRVGVRRKSLYLDRPLAAGSRIHVTLTFPPHVTLTETAARPIHRARSTSGSPSASRIGIAAVIEEYEFLQSVVSGGRGTS
jgi:hypothetical protein